VIRYNLICSEGHEFESWFSNSRACDMQLKRKLVTCPVCESAKVQKAIMAPGLIGAKEKSEPAVDGKQQAAILLSEKDREARALLKSLRDHVTKNAEHVGPQFPKLAREMHHGEIERRSIYGDARPDEVRSLLEEGVEVHPLPILPEDRN